MSEQLLMEPADLAAVNRALKPHELSPEAQAAVICARCILSRFQGDVETEGPPGFIVPDVSRCRELGSIVVSTVKVTARLGLTATRPLESSSTIARLYGSAQRPSLIVPVGERGQQIFRPEQRPGCERKLQHTIVDSFRRGWRNTLAAGARAALEDEGFTVDDLAAFSEEPPSIAGTPLKSFLQRGLLSATTTSKGRVFRLTSLGIWLAEGLSGQLDRVKKPPPGRHTLRMARELADAGLEPPAAEPIEPPPPAAEPPRPKPPVTPRPRDLVLELIRSRYPTQRWTQVRAAVQPLLGQGILEIAGEPGTQNPGLQFTQAARQHLSQDQQAVLAAWKGIDPLVYGRTFTTDEVQTILYRLTQRGRTMLDTYAEKVVYRQLLERLAEDRRRNGQT